MSESPRPAMLTAAEALAQLFAAAEQRSVATQAETLDTLHANRRILAAPLTSQLSVPPADNSAMDGYAVRSSELAAQTGAAFVVSQRIPAGHAPQALQAGTVARIFTGAMIPEGADAVVMQERAQAETDANGHTTARFAEAPQAGENIRRAGEDIQAGHEILPAGTRLTPAALGLAASVGLAQVPVVPRLKVAVFFTGDELTMPGEALKPGAIYNSNRFVLRGLLENLGCEITDFGNVPDTLAATRATLRQAAAKHDLIITSGGVSVGEEDHIKPAVEAEGHLKLWQIAIKPGKPLAFGEVNKAGQDATAFFIGLPGNPVSSFVTFLMFVRPFMLRLQGVPAAQCQAAGLPLRADFTWPKGTKIEPRNEFLRVQLNAEGGVSLFPNQGSGVLTSAVWGDGLVDNPAGHKIQAGEMVRFLPFSQLLY